MTSSERWLQEPSVGSWIDWERWPRESPPWVTVACRLPSGYDAYARLRNPLVYRGARRCWAEIAADAGVELKPEMRGEELLVQAGGQEYGPWVYSGQSLGLDYEQWPVLRSLLLQHTTSDSLIMGFWDGHGDSLVPFDRQLHYFGIRDFALAEIPRDELESSEILRANKPSLVWPADRAWFVHADIEDMSTFVCGPSAAIEEILSAPRLEALPTDLNAEI